MDLGIISLSVVFTVIILIELYKAAQKGWWFMVQVVLGAVISIIVCTFITKGLTNFVQWQGWSENNVNLVFTALALLLGSGMLLYFHWQKRIRPAIVIPVTYLLNLAATLLIAIHWGYEISTKTVESFGLVVGLAVFHVMLLWFLYGITASTKPPEQRPTFWLLGIWSFALIVISGLLSYGYLNGTITDTTLNQTQLVTGMAKTLQAKQQAQIHEDEFKQAVKDFAAADKIGDTTAMAEALARADEARQKSITITRTGIEPLPPLNTVSTSIKTVKDTVEEIGLVGGAVKGAWKLAFGDILEGTEDVDVVIVNPPDVGRTTHKVEAAPTRLLTVYNGDEFEYWSPQPFKIIEKVEGVEVGSHLHNECKSADPRFFKFFDLPRTGVEIYIISLDNQEFQMEYRVIRSN